MMLGWLDVCVLLVVLEQGCESRGLAVRPQSTDHSAYHDRREDQSADHSYQAYPFMEFPMHPVSVEYFMQQATKAKTYHDILRIFYGRKDILTNDVIDSLVASQPHSNLYNLYLGRPRIGGLTDTMSFLLQRRRSLESSMTSSYMQDTSQNDHYLPSHDASQDARRSERGRRRERRPRRRKDHRRRHRHDADLKRELEDATKHFKEMGEKTLCKDPVPVVLRIRDISSSPNREYFPQCTIVHRCRKDSGCCNETSICAPKSNTTISKYFLALEYKDTNVQLAHTRFVESLTFENHTECECTPIQLIPKCLECPHPFYLRRENKTECSCDCFDKDRTCLRIKKGRKPLTEDQLRCIKEGQCHPPKCQYGVFEQDNVRSGYCPKRPRKHPQNGHYWSLSYRRNNGGYS